MERPTEKPASLYSDGFPWAVFSFFTVNNETNFRSEACCPVLGDSSNHTLVQYQKFLSFRP